MLALIEFVVKHCLAVFDLVFLRDPSFKSTFAQNKSCSSYRSLQLLFWPNFMFQCKIWSFGWSKSAENHSISVNGDSPVLLSAPPALDVGAATRRPSRRTSLSARVLSARELWRLLVLISSPSSRPRQAEPELERAATAAGRRADHPRRSASIARAPSHSTSSSISSTRSAARPCPSLAGIEPVEPGRH